MPACPACGETVPYRELAFHERYCEKLNGDQVEAATVEALDRRLETMEQKLERRLRKIEANLRASQMDQERERDRSSRRRTGR